MSSHYIIIINYTTNSISLSILRLTLPFRVSEMSEYVHNLQHPLFAIYPSKSEHIPYQMLSYTLGFLRGIVPLLRWQIPTVALSQLPRFTTVIQGFTRAPYLLILTRKNKANVRFYDAERSPSLYFFVCTLFPALFVLICHPAAGFRCWRTVPRRAGDLYLFKILFTAFM